MDNLPLEAEAVAFVRADFNVSIGGNGEIDPHEDYRIKAALPTLRELVARRMRVIVATHLGQPTPVGSGEVRLPWDLEPVRVRLSELLGKEVARTDFLFGSHVAQAVAKLPVGAILLLPNLRLDSREEEGSEALAEALLQPATIYINEAFSACHRAHASVAVAPRFRPSAAGRRTVQEVDRLTLLRNQPRKPYLAIIGGSKIETKVGLLQELLGLVDQVFVGGQIANVFLQAQGFLKPIDEERDEVRLAAHIWQLAQGRIHLPIDVVIGPDVVTVPVAEIVNIMKEDSGVWDLGPRSVEAIVASAASAKTILWNGPLGRFEWPDYRRGTVTLAEGLAEVSAYRVVGGGDTVNALEQVGLTSRYDHVSVGGGALVTFLEGTPLPGLIPLYQT